MIEYSSASLTALADIAICASNDFHTLHFNFQGEHFDIMHKKVLKRYYEQAAEDYDELAEKARMYGEPIPNPNKAAERIHWDGWEGYCNYQEAVTACDEVLETLVTNYTKVFIVMNDMGEDDKSIGIANFLQTRIEYWSKELHYFNKSRIAQETVEVSI